MTKKERRKGKGRGERERKWKGKERKKEKINMEKDKKWTKTKEIQKEKYKKTKQKHTTKRNSMHFSNWETLDPYVATGPSLISNKNDGCEKLSGAESGEHADQRKVAQVKRMRDKKNSKGENRLPSWKINI